MVAGDRAEIEWGGTTEPERARDRRGTVDEAVLWGEQRDRDLLAGDVAEREQRLDRRHARARDDDYAGGAGERP